LYSIVFPNKDLQGVVYALEERGSAPQEAVAIVQQTIDAAGPLTRAVPAAYFSGMTATVRGSGSSHLSKKRQASYIAWFQKHPKPLVLIITAYEGDGGERAYQINEGDVMFMVRGYTLPVLLFAISLFLVRRRTSLPPAL
jgi:hypothetical protein